MNALYRDRFIKRAVKEKSVKMENLALLMYTVVIAFVVLLKKSPLKAYGPKVLKRNCFFKRKAIKKKAFFFHHALTICYKKRYIYFVYFIL